VGHFVTAERPDPAVSDVSRRGRQVP